MQRLKEILHCCKSNDTQVAYMNRGNDEYTPVYAYELAQEIEADFDNRKDKCEGDAKKLSSLQQHVRASHCAGKHYTVGLIVGKGEELSFHFQWKNREKRSYFSRLPSGDRSKPDNYATMKRATYENGCQVNDCHNLAIHLLKEAINNGIQVTFTCKCPQRQHVIPLFTTNSTMYAKEEVTVLNNDLKTVRLDLAIYDRVDHALLFCVEVFNTHKTVENSRKGFLWCEVIAGRVLDVIEDCKNSTLEITIPTEPRMDVERSCMWCIQMDEAIRKREAEKTRQLILKHKAEEASAKVTTRPSVKQVLFFVRDNKIFGTMRKTGFGPYEDVILKHCTVPAVICNNRMNNKIAVCFVPYETPPTDSISLPLYSNWLCHKMFSFYAQEYKDKMFGLAVESNMYPCSTMHDFCRVEWHNSSSSSPTI